MLTTDYDYDWYGNMQTDWKGISNISYNHLNLPVKVKFHTDTQEDKYIYYIYNALGVKVGKHVFHAPPDAGGTNVYTDYLGGFQYVDSMLQFFPTSEGYVNVIEGQLFNYVYSYTDHLGNIRLNYTQDPVDQELRILEENHYYPFGMKHANYNDDSNDYVKNEIGEVSAVIEQVERSNYQYKYNGKEYQDELSLNWYDYQARNYDPAIGRWMNMVMYQIRCFFKIVL